MKKVMIRSSILSVTAAVALLTSGCGGGGGGSTPATDIPSTSVSDITVSGAAVDGYLVYSTVCLDLSKDGYCQLGGEPAASTDVNGSYSLKLTAAHQAHANFDTAPLLVYGGYDADTNSDFTGKLKAALGDEGIVNITPVTTMVEAMVQKATSGDSNQTKAEIKAQAETSVKAMLGLAAGVDLNADPVKAAKTDSSLLNAALQIQKSLEVLATALKQAGSTESAHDLVENLYENLATAMESNEDNKTLDSILTAAVTADTTLSDAQKATATASATAMTAQVKTIIGTVAIANTASIGTSIGAVKKNIVTKVENNETAEDIELFDFDAVSDKGFILLHAEEILDIIDYDEDDFSDLALKVKNIFVNDGNMTDADLQFLSIETEISLLKGSSDTAVQNVGTEFEKRVTGHKADLDKIETFANAITLPFSVGMSIYSFNEESDSPAYSVHTLGTDGSIEEDRMVLNSTGSFVADTRGDDYTDYVLENGSWVERSNSMAYTLSTDKLELNVGSEVVKIVKKIDLVTPSPDDKEIVDEINDEVYGDDISFSTGAEAYVLAFQSKEQYELYYMPTMQGTDTGYSSLESYKESRTDYVSEWDTMTIPGTEIEIIIGKPNPTVHDDDDSEGKMAIATLLNGVVYEGNYKPASTEFDINDNNLEFNKIAFDDIIAAISSNMVQDMNDGEENSPTDTENPSTTFDMASFFVGKTLYSFQPHEDGGDSNPNNDGMLYGSSMTFNTGSVSDNVYSGFSGGNDEWGDYGIVGSSPENDHSYTIDGNKIRLTEEPDSQNEGGTVVLTHQSSTTSNGEVFKVSSEDGTLITMIILYPDAVSRDAGLAAMPSGTEINPDAIMGTLELRVSKTTFGTSLTTEEQILNSTGALVTEDTFIETISMNGNEMILNEGEASVKYLGTIPVNDFNTATGAGFVNATIHKVAFIRQTTDEEDGPAGAGGFFYFLDKTGLDEFMYYYTNNHETITEPLEFGKFEMNFTAAYEAATAQTAPNLGALYQIRVEMTGSQDN